ncbi:MAG: hypothetical protein PQJ59_04405 [Spirochaetales bacterium]|nr:hypothetical protein [Spirochaetales bacterium]
MKQYFLSKLCIFSFLIGLSPLMAEENRFTWNVGTYEIVLNQWSGEGEDSDWDMSIPELNLTIGDFQYHAPRSPWTFQISLYELRNNYEEERESYQAILSPMEVNYNLLGHSSLLLGPYIRGGMGWTFDDQEFYPYYEGGMKIGLLARRSFIHYSWRNSLYMGYDSEGDFNIGLQLDYGPLLPLPLFS